MSGVPKLPAGAARPRDGWQLFSDGVKVILEKWELFHTAVVEEWGGRGSRSKFDHIVEDLVSNCEDQWREGNDLHLDTLDVYLLECLEADFNIDFEDDSAVTQVSTLIACLYNRCALGLLDEARSLLHSVITAAAAKAASKARTNDSSDDDDEDGSGEEGEEGAGGDGSGAGGSGRGPRRVVDEDGWETIVPKGGKGAKPAPTAAPAGGAGTGGSSDASASGGEGGAGAGAAMDVDR